MMQRTRYKTLMSCILARVIAMPVADAEAESRKSKPATSPVLGPSLFDHREYLAVPYAAPPTGALRFRYPRPAAH